MKLSIDASVVQIDMRQRPDSEKWLVEPRLGSENVRFSRRTHGGFPKLGMRNLPSRPSEIAPSGHLRRGRLCEEFSEFSVRGLGHLGGT